jgi:DNA invertase Pin-like site-specific DNA recombinase
MNLVDLRSGSLLKENNMVVAYSYRRYSAPHQGRGDSLRRQEALLKGWLDRHPDVRLDTTLVDAGVSAHRGRQREDDACLGQFLADVKAGRVRRGSHLLVEALDRLSREKVRVALKLMLDLIDAGIRIVQLQPVEAVYDEDADAMTLMLMIAELSRGYHESKMKSAPPAGRCSSDRWRCGSAQREDTPGLFLPPAG